MRAVGVIVSPLPRTGPRTHTLLTSEQLEIRALARDFAAGEIRPRSRGWDEAGALDEEAIGKLAELGFLGMLTPEEHGGLGFDVPTYLTVLEALAWGDAALALTVAIQNGPLPRLLQAWGTEAQQSAWLPRMASGEVMGAFAMSEAEAGSDAASLRTTATPSGDGWEISGAKRWVTNGASANVAFVFARTGERSDGRPAIGCFLVDTDASGYRVTDREKTMGLRASETVSVSLDGVHVAGDRLLGDPERGLSYALDALTIGRLGIAAQAVGIAQAALEHATSYAGERKQFGRPIAEFGAIRGKLARMATRVASSRALMLDVGARVGGDELRYPGRLPLRAEAAMAKLAASEAATWVADEAVQIYGGYGYMRDYPVEQLLRDAKGTEIYEGTSEIMRLVIGESLTDEP